MEKADKKKHFVRNMPCSDQILGEFFEKKIHFLHSGRRLANVIFPSNRIPNKIGVQKISDW